MSNLISESETCTKEMCEQAFELTEEVKEGIKQSKEDTERKKRHRKRSILSLSGLGFSIVVGILGARFWDKAALLCFLAGGVCYAIQIIVNREKNSDVGHDA